MNPVPSTPVRRALPRVRLPALLLLTTLAGASLACAQTDGAWGNTTSGGNWSSAANWSGGFVAGGAGADADFSQLALTVPTTVHLDTPVTIGEIDFGNTNPPTASTVSSQWSNGNTTVLTSGWTLDNNGNSTNVLTLATTDSSTPVIFVGNLGTYYLSYAVTPYTATISAVIAGTQGLDKTGAGTLILSGNNTFSGGLTVSAGQVTLQGNQSFTGGITVSGNTSILSFNTNASFNNQNIAVSGGGTLLDTQAAGTTFGSAKSSTPSTQTISIGSGGATIKTTSYSDQAFTFNIADAGTGNTGTLLINAANYDVSLWGNNSGFSGGYEISTGFLVFAAANSTPTTVNSVLIDAKGGLVVDGNPLYTTPNAFLSSGVINPNSQGSIFLTGVTNSDNVNMTGYANLFVGISGYVNLPSNMVTYTGTITPAGGVYRLGGGSSNITFNLANNNALTGSASVLFGPSTGGGNKIQLSGSNDYTGGSTINTIVTVAASGALGTGAISMGSSGNLTFKLSGNYTLNNAISGSGVLVQAGSGSVIDLAGVNTYTGATTVSAGTLLIDGSLTSAVTVSSGARIGGQGSANKITFNSGAGLAYNVASVTQSAGLAVTTFTGTGIGSFTVYLTGAAAGFTDSQNYSWTVLTTSAVSSISLTSLTLDTSGFGQSYTGTFSLAESGNSLLVNYTAGAIPEPATYGLLAGAGFLAFALWRKRGARS